LEAAGEDGGEFPTTQHEPDTFLGRWRRELEELLGLRRRRFDTVMDVFRRSFPDRRISPRDTFVSLSGDSLSFVTVSLGLDELVPELPENWAERPIEELQALCSGETASPTTLRPEIMLRVASMLGVVVSHFGISWSWLAGASKLMMVISGISFARFTWNGDPRHALKSSARFVVNMGVPALILVTAVFLVKGQIDWPILLFIDNITTEWPPDWWAGWYLECLAQYLVVMVALAFVPGVWCLSTQRKYLFGMALTIAGIAAYVGFRALAPAWLTYNGHMPQDYFWLFALGWLISASETRAQKLTAFALLLVSIGMVPAANVFAVQRSYNDSFYVWLLLGAAVLLTRWSFSVPRWMNVAAATLARAMLFVYLLHLPLARLVPSTRQTLTITVGFLASLVIWALWESLWQTVLSYWKYSRGARKSVEGSCRVQAEAEPALN
jgi:hypothetical protein